MAKQVIALRVGNASIPLYASDWPAIREAVEEALLGKDGHACHASGEKELVSATRYTVASKSRLAYGL